MTNVSALDQRRQDMPFQDNIGTISARLERLPFTRWHARALGIVGAAHFFDAFDALTIAFVLPVLIEQWGLAPGAAAGIIAIGYVGQLIGAISFGRAAESFGRVRTLRWAIALLSVFTLLSGFTSGLVSFVLLRFVQGIGLGGETPVGAAYVNEICPARWRGRAVFGLQMIFAFGVMVTAIAALWIIPVLGWRAMFVIGAGPLLLALVLPRILPESPRWLAGQGRGPEAGDIVARIEHDLVSRAIMLPDPEPVALPSRTGKTSLTELFHGGYAPRTIGLWIAALCASIAGFGIVTWMPTLYRTVFHLPLDQALRYGFATTFASFLGVLIATLLIDRIGRLRLFMLGFGGGALSLLYLAASGVAIGAFYTMVLATIGCCFLSFLLAGLYVYSPEIYPTRIRATGTGMASAWLRFGAIAGPLLVGVILPAFGLAGVFSLFAGAAIVGAVTIRALGVETLGRSLEQIEPR